MVVSVYSNYDTYLKEREFEDTLKIFEQYMFQEFGIMPNMKYSDLDLSIQTMIISKLTTSRYALNLINNVYFSRNSSYTEILFLEQYSREENNFKNTLNEWTVVEFFYLIREHITILEENYFKDMKILLHNFIRNDERKKTPILECEYLVENRDVQHYYHLGQYLYYTFLDIMEKFFKLNTRLAINELKQFYKVLNSTYGYIVYEDDYTPYVIERVFTNIFSTRIHLKIMVEINKLYHTKVEQDKKKLFYSRYIQHKYLTVLNDSNLSSVMVDELQEEILGMVRDFIPYSQISEKVEEIEREEIHKYLKYKGVYSYLD